MRRLLAVALAIVAFNFLFISDASGHVTIGLIWLAADVVLWWPDIARLKIV